MTPKQKRLLDFIEEYLNRHGYSQSQREIARHFGFRSLGRFRTTSNVWKAQEL